MGNYVSCALAGLPSGKQSKSPKVILPSGEVEQFDHPVKAAELMLDAPNYFLVNSKSLIVSRRLIALNADDQLQVNNLYVMFPMRRLNSCVTTADMGALFLVGKRGGARRVAPACSGPLPVVCEEKAGLEELWSREFKQWRSIGRSKRPVLETIVEEDPTYSSS